ncbi:MAG TPA: signal peptide peptidase SppA [Aromatoleum sp.]|uniref:signal peptide peptidase SppA n=1 Tax=Aromatoleum sp. TaxID=2307007 RepID=UPI002B4A35A3|nr:signal peptide peptidase SppA [Aromatoleum sp.]HJV24124.1 signal peptide peptidase SppA [Aromatoleum sp.]
MGSVGRFLAGLGRAIDLVRRVLINLVFVAIVAVIVVVALRPAPGVPDGAALLVRPMGTIVEQMTLDDPLGLVRSGGVPVARTPLRDLLEAIQAAREDSRIKAIVIDTDGMGSSGLSKLAELRDALVAFKTTGKPVFARGERFTQAQYYLASVADVVHVAPDGFVLLTGLARYSNYYKGALDKLGVKVHVFRVGEYKSFAEPFTRSDMSDEDRAATRDLLQGLWDGMRSGVAGSRKLAPEKLERYVSDYPGVLADAAGDPAKAAQDSGLVDGMSQRDEWRDMLKSRVGSADDGKDYRHIEASDYIAAVRAARPHESDRIAVLVAQGAIVDGGNDGESVGGDSLADEIRAAREDGHVKAVVLRIDSPGGSAWASEVIRRELELTRRAGKPVVASMSSVAASGGYWVAAGADEIWARPETLTGSIGVFALFPELAEPLDKLGVTTDGVSTGPLAGALDPRRPLDPGLAKAIQLGVDHSYQRFLQTVSNARSMPVADVDPIARGRVWTGETASKLGLVDHLGGVDGAIASAAKRAGIEHYETVWQTPEIHPLQLLMRRLIDAAMPASAAVDSPLQRVFSGLRAEAAELLRWNDPQHIYLHCLCEAP